MKSASVAGSPVRHAVGTESPSALKRSMGPPPK